MKVSRWFKDNLWIASAIFIGSVVWILLLALMSQTISALVKWRVVASGVMLGLFFIPSVFGVFVNEVFQTRMGQSVQLCSADDECYIRSLWHFCSEQTRLCEPDFNDDGDAKIVLAEPPLWSSWTVLFLVCAVCLALLSRR